MNAHEKMDKIGFLASTTCAVHCMLMPVVITLLPLVGLSFFASETMEWILFGLSAVFGVSSLCWGYRKHRSRKALAVLAIGLAVLSLGRITHESTHHALWSVALLVAGGSIVAFSHYINILLCKICHRCHDE